MAEDDRTDRLAAATGDGQGATGVEIEAGSPGRARPSESVTEAMVTGEPVTEALVTDSGPGTAQNALPEQGAATYAFGMMPGQTDVFIAVAASPSPAADASPTNESPVSLTKPVPANPDPANPDPANPDPAADDATPKVPGGANPAPQIRAYSQALPVAAPAAEPTAVGAAPPYSAPGQYGMVPAGMAESDHYAETGLNPVGSPATGYPATGYPAAGFAPPSGGQPAVGYPPATGYDTGYVSSVYSNPLATPPRRRALVVLPVLLGVLVLVAAGLVGYLLLGDGDDEPVAAAPELTAPPTAAAPTTAPPANTVNPAADTDHQVRAARVGDCAEVLIGAQTTFTLLPCGDGRANYQVVGKVESSAQCATKWLRNTNPRLTPADVVLCISPR